MTDAFWDDKEIFPSGDFIRFETIGDTVTGTITAMRRHVFDDGKIVPQIELDTADGPKTLTAGQTRLKAELVELRPQVGDRISITMTAIEKRAGGRTLKHFDVTIGATAPPAPAAAPAPTARLVDQIRADKARLAAQPRTPSNADAPF